MIRVYILIGVVVALVGSHWWAYHKGYVTADQSAKVASLQVQLDEANRRNAAKDRVAEELREETERRAAEVQTLSEQVNDYADILKSRDDGGCALSPDDVERLRSIR